MRRGRWVLLSFGVIHQIIRYLDQQSETQPTQLLFLQYKFKVDILLAQPTTTYCGRLLAQLGSGGNVLLEPSLLGDYERNYEGTSHRPEDWAPTT